MNIRELIHSEPTYNELSIGKFVNDMAGRIQIDPKNIRILDSPDFWFTDKNTGAVTLNGLQRIGFTETPITFPSEIPDIKLEFGPDKRVHSYKKPDSFPINFETKNSFEQTLFTLALSKATLKKIVENTPSAYRVKTLISAQREEKILDKMLSKLISLNDDEVSDMDINQINPYLKNQISSTSLKSLYETALKSKRTQDLNTAMGIALPAVLTFCAPQTIPAPESPTPIPPTPVWDKLSNYSPDLQPLILNGSYQPQEAILTNWIENTWGPAGNTPFPSDAVIKFHIIQGPNNGDSSDDIVAVQYNNNLYLPPLNQDPQQINPGSDFPVELGPIAIPLTEEIGRLEIINGQIVTVDTDKNGNSFILQRYNIDSGQFESHFELGAWAENNDGNFTPSIIYPYVGSLYHDNRHYIDLTYLGIPVAARVDRDVTTIEDLDSFKQEQAEKLYENQSLRFQIDLITLQLDQSKFYDYTIIVDKEQVKWIVDTSGEKLTYYVLDQNNSLKQLSKEEEPQLLPELRVNGPYIERADTGEQILFKGITLPINETEREGKSILRYVKMNVEANEKLGLYSNFVRLSAWSKDWSNSETEEIRKVADYLEQKGMYMVFTPHNDQRNEYNNNKYLPNEKDKQTAIDVATVLKGKPNVIIGLWNEPTDTNWSEWSSTISDIYAKFKLAYGEEQMPLIMVPGPDGDFREANIPLPNNSFVIDVHPYVIPNGPNSFKHVDYMWTQKIGEVPILITELAGTSPAQPELTPIQGYKDLENMKHILKIVNDPNNKNMIGYAPWRGDGYEEGVRVEFDPNSLSSRGNLLTNDRESYPQTYFTD